MSCPRNDTVYFRATKTVTTKLAVAKMTTFFTLYQKFAQPRHTHAKRIIRSLQKKIVLQS